ncbi:hypothetical protein [Streptomyces sp. NPDC054865]
MGREASPRRYNYLGWDCTLGRGKANLGLLAEGGYLTEVERGVYELRATDSGAPTVTGSADAE